jgi:hypothetical protein
LKASLEIEGGEMAFNPPLGEAAAERGYHLAQSAALTGDVSGHLAHGVRQTCSLRRDEEYRCLVQLTHKFRQGLSIMVTTKGANDFPPSPVTGTVVSQFHQ